MIERMMYLRELKASLEELERAYIHINMNLYDDRLTIMSDVKKYQDRHCNVEVSRNRTRIQWYVFDNFSIDVSHSTMDKLRGLFEYMEENLSTYPPLIEEDLIKKIALAYIQTIGLT